MIRCPKINCQVLVNLRLRNNHLKDQELFKTVIPSKVFESIGMGIPILHGVKGESADIIRNGNVGKVFNPEDVESLVCN